MNGEPAILFDLDQNPILVHPNCLNFADKFFRPKKMAVIPISNIGEGNSRKLPSRRSDDT
jgi:hypothetical protein